MGFNSVFKGLNLAQTVLVMYAKFQSTLYLYSGIRGFQNKELQSFFLRHESSELGKLKKVSAAKLRR